MVHRLSDESDIAQPVSVEVHALFHHQQDRPELQEVFLLCRSQWICIEERNNLRQKISLVPHAVDHQIFLVIVMSAVAIDAATSKEFPQEL